MGLVPDPRPHEYHETYVVVRTCARVHACTHARVDTCTRAWHRALLSAWILSDWFIMYEWRARKSCASTPRADLDLSNIRAFIYLNDFIILEENEILFLITRISDIYILYIFLCLYIFGNNFWYNNGYNLWNFFQTDYRLHIYTHRSFTSAILNSSLTAFYTVTREVRELSQFEMQCAWLSIVCQMEIVKFYVCGRCITCIFSIFCRS